MTGAIADPALLNTMHALFTAELRGDVPGMERLIAADYHGFDSVGHPQDQEALLAPYRAGAVRLEQLTPTDVHVRQLGEVGLVTGRAIIRGHASGKPFDLRLRFLDVFVYREERWQLAASQLARL